MTGVYFLTLAVLLVAAYYIGRSRALAAGLGASRFHSLPAYHGLLPMAAVLMLMLLTYLIGMRIVGWWAESGALAILGPEYSIDQLKRATALREIANIASGRHSGDVTAASMEQDAQVGAGQHSALGIGVVGRAHQGALQQLAALDVVAQIGDVILIGHSDHRMRRRRGLGQ